MHLLLPKLFVRSSSKGVPHLRSFHAVSSSIVFPEKLHDDAHDHRRSVPKFHCYKSNFSRPISSQSIRQSISNIVTGYFGPDTLFVNSSMKFLTFCHDYTGLPWWATICLVTVGLKTLLVFPLAVHGRKVNAKLVLMNEEMMKVLPQLEKEVHIIARSRGWTPQDARNLFHVNKKKIFREYYIKENCHPMKGFVSLLTQLPLWLSVSFALRHLSGSFYWTNKLDSSQYIAVEMKNEGALWFSNLFVPDQLYILPIILLSTNLLIGAINLYELSTMKKANRISKVLTGMMMFYSVAIFSISTLMPSCITFYWSTSAVCSLVQLLLLSNLRVQSALGIPDVRHLLNKKSSREEEL